MTVWQSLARQNGRVRDALNRFLCLSSRLLLINRIESEEINKFLFFTVSAREWLDDKWRKVPEGKDESSVEAVKESEVVREEENGFLGEVKRSEIDHNEN